MSVNPSMHFLPYLCIHATLCYDNDYLKKGWTQYGESTCSIWILFLSRTNLLIHKIGIGHIDRRYLCENIQSHQSCAVLIIGPVHFNVETGRVLNLIYFNSPTISNQIYFFNTTFMEKKMSPILCLFLRVIYYAPCF